MSKKKFEIAKLDSANLVELEGFKQSQIKLVEDHPFVEINDPKSYQDAKKSRTALKTGRTTIEKQDKLIGSKLSSFRKETIAKKDELVSITKPHEEKQQTEIDRWEKILQDEKDREAKLEEDRIQGIKDKIDETKTSLKSFVDNVNFDNIEVQERMFNDHVASRSGFDYQEFEFLFEEMIEEKRMEMVQKIQEVKEAETIRLEQLAKDQQSKIDSLFREATEMIDNALIDTVDLLEPALKEILEIDFDFGDLKIKFDEMVGSINGKAKVKIEWLKEQKIRYEEEQITIQKNNVINVREGLLDLIHQMTIENYEEETIKIKDAVDQDFEKTVPKAMDEVQKLKDRANDALKRKLEEIAGEIKKIKDAEKAEEERMEKVMKERIKIITDLGMIEIEESCEFVGFGLKYDVSDIYEAETIEMITDEINVQIECVKSRKEAIKKIGYKFDDFGFKGFGVTYCDGTIANKDDEQFEMFVEKLKNIKKADKEEKAKNKRIDPERKKILNFIDKDIRFPNMEPKVKQPEMTEFQKHFNSELNALCDTLIEKLKSL